MSVNLGVRRDGTEKTVAVTIGEVPAKKGEFAASIAHATEPAAAPPPWDLDLQLAQRLKSLEPRTVALSSSAWIPTGAQPISASRRATIDFKPFGKNELIMILVTELCVLRCVNRSSF